MNHRIAQVITIATLALAVSAFAATAATRFHVAPTGNDANPGTEEAPFQSLARAVAAVSPGDIILMRGGTHAYAATVVLDKAGTSNSPIRIEAFPGERPVLDYSAWKPTEEKERGVARLFRLAVAAAFPLLVQAAEQASSKEGTLIVQAESGKFTGIIDRHSCWHNVMLTDEPHSTHSGEAIVDTKNEVGSYVEVDYVATWAGPHRITARYTHPRDEPRPADLLVAGAK